MIIRENFARDVLRLIVWYPLRWMVRIAPLKYSLNVLRGMGDLHYFLSRGKRAALLNNLKMIFRDPAKTGTNFFPHTIREYFRNHYVNRLHIFLFPRLNKKNIDQVHTFEGMDHLNKALALGRGCILLHPHFGPLFLPVHALGLEGYPVAALLLTINEGLSFMGRHIAYKLRVKYEKKMKAHLIYADSFLRPLFQCLKQNMVVFSIGDGSDGGRRLGKFAEREFLGKKMLFPRGPALLSKKTGAPIIPIFTVLQEDGRYKTTIHEPINLNSDASEDEIASIFIAKMESYVQRYPHLWHFWDEFEERIRCNMNHSNDQAVQ